MTCLECQEKIGRALRAGELPRGLEAHLARCRSCREFSRALAVMAPALDRWGATAPREAHLVAREALVERLRSVPEASRPGTMPRANSTGWLHYPSPCPLPEAERGSGAIQEGTGPVLSRTPLRFGEGAGGGVMRVPAHSDSSLVPHWGRGRGPGSLRDPALIAVPGAAAMALGALLAPEWLRLALMLWFPAATILVSVVLLRYGVTAHPEGNIR